MYGHGGYRECLAIQFTLAQAHKNVIDSENDFYFLLFICLLVGLFVFLRIRFAQSKYAIFYIFFFSHFGILFDMASRDLAIAYM